MSRTEERQRGIFGGGSAYGYDRRMSRASAAPGVTNDRSGAAAARTESFAAQSRTAGRNSFSSTNQYAPDFEEIGHRPGLSFAQRFLLAQDDSVFTISDLWVAAAINGDEAYEDVFDDEEEGYDDDEALENDSYDGSIVEDSIDEEDEEDEDREEPNEGSGLLAPRHLAPLNFAQRKLSRAGYSDAGRSYTSAGRPRSRVPSCMRIREWRVLCCRQDTIRSRLVLRARLGLWASNKEEEATAHGIPHWPAFPKAARTVTVSLCRDPATVVVTLPPRVDVVLPLSTPPVVHRPTLSLPRSSPFSSGHYRALRLDGVPLIHLRPSLYGLPRNP